MLDSNVIIDFRDWGQLDGLLAAATSAPMAIVEQVYTEVALAAAGDSAEVVGKKRKTNEALRGSALTVVGFLPGTPAESLYLTLAGAKTHDRGEAASIAFARHDGPECVFVSRDKNATLMALDELSDGTERVMRPFQFVRRVCDAGALEAGVVRAVARYVTNWGLVPSWWAPWLAELPVADRYNRDVLEEPPR
ncbi:MAG TPA: hypothetical protein VFS00_24465 [Polyangiaceae bacterium]|nr:hypothetical protein [Polyangiaceae bacterium]